MLLKTGDKITNIIEIIKYSFMLLCTLIYKMNAKI